MKPTFPLAPIRLIAIDIDGTLIGHDLEIRPRVQRAIAEARQRGVQVSLCTGRPANSSVEFVRALDLDGLHIFDSGATISNPMRGETFWTKGVDPAIALQVLESARANNVFLEVYAGGGYYVAYESEHSRMHGELQRWQPTVTDLAEVIRTHPISKMEAVALDAAEAVRVQAMLDPFSAVLECGWAIVPGLTVRFVNILTKGISKGDAILRLLEHLSLSPTQAMGIGDGPNDEPLIEAVGFGVAMGNGVESLKQLANVVTGSVEQDGLADAIERYVLNANYQA